MESIRPYITAAVTLTEGEPQTLISCILALDEYEAKSKVAKAISIQYPSMQIINITATEPPAWMRDYYLNTDLLPFTPLGSEIGHEAD